MERGTEVFGATLREKSKSSFVETHTSYHWKFGMFFWSAAFSKWFALVVVTTIGPSGGLGQLDGLCHVVAKLAAATRVPLRKKVVSGLFRL